MLACDQLPRYLIFLGWQMLALWLGSAVLSSFAKDRSSRTWISIIFIGIFLLYICGSIVVSIITNKEDYEDSPYVHDKYFAYVDIANYFTIVISILVYWCRLLQIYVKLNKHLPFQARIRFLLVLIFIMCAIFFARFLYVFFYAFGINHLQNLLGKLSDEVLNDNKPMSVFYVFYMIFFLIFEISPSVLLLLTYFLLSVHATLTKKERKEHSNRAHSSSRGKDKTSHSERSGKESGRKKGKRKKKKSRAASEQLPNEPFLEEKGRRQYGTNYTSDSQALLSGERDLKDEYDRGRSGDFGDGSEAEPMESPPYTYSSQDSRKLYSNALSSASGNPQLQAQLSPNTSSLAHSPQHVTDAYSTQQSYQMGYALPYQSRAFFESPSNRQGASSADTKLAGSPESVSSASNSTTFTAELLKGKQQKTPREEDVFLLGQKPLPYQQMQIAGGDGGGSAGGKGGGKEGQMRGWMERTDSSCTEGIGVVGINSDEHLMSDYDAT
ncbi:uncharacterized protein MONOS_6669 [Monocercomonoides exilis]|uniref:uncharacterized protein n=1 Tax=Monocercomonoides exilis TaxID=2049356 RepID=UPI00355A992B|nr:hypothetical protein MONOS_6669 [Monocercomonoides exilis]|eukprot:MONOS_6669.1-p1 / transcript=MONOS_6669.1 / gene=MONOS_6669 / organism=Monocercomonoides_exilis_PA203 / gene_product=unspecified product / transcript_product=unspecified product / location=Mono_scaffold00214:52187-53850(-) / protein_length=496 / sequence_SO=supercontig / SO=protein_coding / is_pseudo=false